MPHTKPRSHEEKKQNHGRQNHWEESQTGSVFIPSVCLRGSVRNSPLAFICSHGSPLPCEYVGLARESRKSARMQGRVGSPSRPKLQARMRRLPQTKSSRKTPRPNEGINDRAGNLICENVGLTPSRRKEAKSLGGESGQASDHSPSVPPRPRKRFPACPH
jgi:hypothetical protein